MLCVNMHYNELQDKEKTLIRVFSDWFQTSSETRHKVVSTPL